MLRRPVFLLAVTACTSSGSTPDGLVEPDYPDEVLRNGGFETLAASGFPEDWENFDTNPGGEIVVVDDALFGERALQWRVDAGDGYEYFIHQNDIPGSALPAGRTYELTGFYKFSALGNIGFSQSVRGRTSTDPSYDNFADVTAIPSEADVWEPFRFEFTIPPGTSLPETWEAGLNLLKFNGVPLIVTVDGLSLHAVR